MTDNAAPRYHRSNLKQLGMTERTLTLVALVATLVLDQIVKLGVTAWLGPEATEQRWELIGRFVALQYVENRGAAFGLFEGQTLLLAFAAVIAALILLTEVAKAAATSRFAAGGIGLVLGGAIGNVVDRVRLGYVVDFVAVGIWPKFNVADAAITVGLLILGWYAFYGHGREPRTDRN